MRTIYFSFHTVWLRFQSWNLEQHNSIYTFPQQTCVPHLASRRGLDYNYVSAPSLSFKFEGETRARNLLRLRRPLGAFSDPHQNRAFDKGYATPSAKIYEYSQNHPTFTINLIIGGLSPHHWKNAVCESKCNKAVA